MIFFLVSFGFENLLHMCCIYETDFRTTKVDVLSPVAECLNHLHTFPCIFDGIHFRCVVFLRPSDKHRASNVSYNTHCRYKQQL